MHILAITHKVEYSIRFNGELYHAEITINKEDSTWVEAYVLQNGELVSSSLEEKILAKLKKMI